jgi:hypothetical protein
MAMKLSASLLLIALSIALGSAVPLPGTKTKKPPLLYIAHYHAPVRTIGLWHERDKYLPELKSCYLKYRGQYAAGPGFLASVSSATREHGTYQLMRQQMVFDQTPRKIDLPGNVEIASASLDYRKRSDGN